MKIFLISTSFKDIYGYERMFPLGLGYIAATLMRDGHMVSILEPQLDDMEDRDLVSALQEADLVGITAVTPTFPEAVRISRLVRSAGLKTKVVIGGTHASCFPEQLLAEYPEFDFVVFGEGENTMRELCHGIEKSTLDYGEIDGLCFRDGEKITKNRCRDYIYDLDNMPLPARELVNLSKYNLPLHITKGKKSASMITSRGCPARCIFCSSKVTMGDRLRMHSCSYVIGEIEYLISKYAVKHIQFVDDTFTLSEQRTKQICEEIIKRNIKFEWHCFARVETVNDDMLKLMKRAGCTSILFGIESGDERILRNIKKGISLEKAREAHRACRKHGITILSSFILGNPGEDKATIESTIKFALSLRPTFALFYRLVPYPGSQVYHKYKSENRLKEITSWGDFVPKGEGMVFDHENLSERDLAIAITQAYKRFYFNLGSLFRITCSLRTAGQWKAVFLGMCSLFRQMLKWKS